MKRVLSLVVMGLTLVALSGCGKKQEAEELQPITMESLGTANVPAAAPGETKAQEVKVPPAASETAVQAKEALSLPPQAPYNPTVI